MPNVKLIIEYDGSNFSGWQKQPGVRTIQAEITKAVSLITREEIHHVQASGRTDAGVHAKAQVVNFMMQGDPDLKALRYGISSIFKGEIAVVNAVIVGDHFHALRSAIKKTYIYSILNRPAPSVFDRKFCWHIARNLDLNFLNQQAEMLIGVHDFTSLRASDCMSNSSIREIYSAEFIKEQEYLRFKISGQGFLKNMVRIIVGTLLDLERGKLGNNSILDILEMRDRRMAGVTAPAHGLCLESVEY